MDLNETPHKRYNALSGEWVLVSPHRMKRPWQGKQETPLVIKAVTYDEKCYLCPTNTRADGLVNPDYKLPYAFTNDFSALLPDEAVDSEFHEDDLLIASHVRGLCRVICFSPKHHLTLAFMSVMEIVAVVKLWQKEFEEISKNTWIKNILIFENKGDVMGCSNPHPHGQIWAQSDLPNDIMKEGVQQLNYFKTHGRTLLNDYLSLELKKNERIVCSNEHFVALVPFWAVWPFEIMIIGRTPRQNILQFTEDEVTGLADIISKVTIRYDNLFKTSFPYSAGMHQAPVNDGDHPEWQWHMHFYPPLLRSASVKKFMVGYELLAGPQRDITPEHAALRLREESDVHY